MQHAATVVGRKVVVAGGDTAFGPSNDVKVTSPFLFASFGLAWSLFLIISLLFP